MAHVAANLDPNEVAALVVYSIEHAQKCAKYFHYFHLLRIALHNTKRMQMRIELRLQMQMHFTARIHPTADQLVSAGADVHVAADVDADVDADADIRDDGAGAVGQSSRAAMSQTEQSRDQTKPCLAMRRHSLVGQSVGKNKTLSKQLECVCVCACVCIEKKSVAGLS